MEVIDTLRYKNHLCYAIQTNVYTGGKLSKIFNVRDTARTLLDAKGLYSLFIQKLVQEGNYSIRRQTEFIPGTPIAKTKTVRIKKGKIIIKDSICTTSLYPTDILSTIYKLRILNFKDSLDINCFDDHKNYQLRVRVIKREIIQTQLGKLKCIKLEPILKSSGIFNKKGKLFVWFTDDKKRLPVLIKFKLRFLGSIKCELINYTAGKIINLE